MKTNYFLALFTSATFCLLSATQALSQELEKPLIGHVFYGLMTISNNTPETEEEDFEILVFGADAQKSLGGEMLKYGFETGALFSIDSSVRHLSASSGSEGGKVAVSVDVNSLLIDYFAGGFLSIEPVHWLRLFVGAGPLLIWSLWDSEPEESSSDEFTSQSDSGFGVGVYARAGIDLFFTKKIGITAGARVNETTLCLGDAPYEIDVEGWQYYAGMALRF